VFFACLHGNSENYLIIRELNRDLEYESEMIAIEEDFWNNHILAQVPPPYIEEGALIIESVRRHFGFANASAPTINFDEVMSTNVMLYLELGRRKSVAEASVKIIEDEYIRMKGLIVAEMGVSCTATCSLVGTPYLVTYNPSFKTGVSKENLARMKLHYPDVYDEYVTHSESRRFYVKQQKVKKEEDLVA